jgi:hypothetical protein
MGAKFSQELHSATEQLLICLFGNECGESFERISRKMAWIYLRIQRRVLSNLGMVRVSSGYFRKYRVMKIATKGNE